MPVGVRNPQELFNAMSFHIMNKEERPRRSLDCTCAKHTHGNSSWAQSILLSLQHLCSYHNLDIDSLSPTSNNQVSTNSSVEGPETSLLRQLNQERDLASKALTSSLTKIYSFQKNSHYVLSLSNPSYSLGPCEWEAVAMGIKVLMPLSSHEKLLRNPFTARLYDTLMHVIAPFLSKREDIDSVTIVLPSTVNKSERYLLHR